VLAEALRGPAAPFGLLLVLAVAVAGRRGVDARPDAGVRGALFPAAAFFPVAAVPDATAFPVPVAFPAAAAFPGAAACWLDAPAFSASASWARISSAMMLSASTRASPRSRFAFALSS